MDFDDRYQDGKNGPLKKEIRDRIAVFRTRGSTLADIGEALGFSGPFVSQLLNEKRPGRVRTIHIPRIVKALEDAEREETNISKESPTSVPDAEAAEKHYSVSSAAPIRPQMFIASSSAKLQIAYDLQESLVDDIEATVWTQGVFRPSKSTMESLVERLSRSDFGTFVLAPDDIVEIRNARQQAVRDNVIFELGLFIGHLGRERCFLLLPKGVEDLHLPTDLLGITAATYDAQRQDNNGLAALGPASNRIRREVIRLGRFPRQR